MHSSTEHNAPGPL